MKKTDKNVVKTQAAGTPRQPEDPTTLSDDEPLSRTDRFVIMSMLATSRFSLLDPEEEIGGSTLGSIMNRGNYQLYDDLKPKDLFEEIHVVQLLNMQKIAWECFNEAEKNADYLPAREINLRLGFKATHKFIQLFGRLESHWAKQNSIPSLERVAVPLTPGTLIKGATLRERMEWTRTVRYLDLKPQDAFESMHAGLIIRTQKAAQDCCWEANWKKDDLCAREMNLRYCLKAPDPLTGLLASFESYRAKKAGGVLHNQATGIQKASKVASKAGPDMMNGGMFVRRSNKTRVNINGNGRHA